MRAFRTPTAPADDYATDDLTARPLRVHRASVDDASAAARARAMRSGRALRQRQRRLAQCRRSGGGRAYGDIRSVRRADARDTVLVSVAWLSATRDAVFADACSAHADAAALAVGARAAGGAALDQRLADSVNIKMYIILAL